MSTKKSCALPKSAFPLKFDIKSPSHALEVARELIRPYKNWIVGELAVKFPDGREAAYDEGAYDSLSPKSAKAEAFCALGALNRVNTRHEKLARKFLAQAAVIEEAGSYKPDDVDLAQADEDDITGYNDLSQDKDHHKAVLKMFTTGIRLARKWEAKKAGH